MIELDVKIEAGDLYDYMLMHAYNGAQGLLGSCVGALLILVGLTGGRGIWAVFGLILLLYIPWTLFIKSRQQALNPVFRNPLHYELSDEGMRISQGETETMQSWEDMVKAVSTGRSIILYTSKVNATIFPKRQMGDKKVAVIEMISTHMPPNKVKIRN